MNNDNGILTAAYENTREAAFLPVLAGDDPYNDMVYLLLKDDEPVAAIQHHLDVEDAQVHAMILALGLTECMSDALVSAVQDVMFTDAGDHWMLVDQAEAEKDHNVTFEFDTETVRANEADDAQFKKDHAQGMQ